MVKKGTVSQKRAREKEREKISTKIRWKGPAKGGIHHRGTNNMNNSSRKQERGVEHFRSGWEEKRVCND